MKLEHMALIDLNAFEDWIKEVEQILTQGQFEFCWDQKPTFVKEMKRLSISLEAKKRRTIKDNPYIHLTKDYVICIEDATDLSQVKECAKFLPDKSLCAITIFLESNLNANEDKVFRANYTTPIKRKKEK